MEFSTTLLFAKNKYKHKKGTLILRFSGNSFFSVILSNCCFSFSEIFHFFLIQKWVIKKLSTYSESAWKSLSPCIVKISENEKKTIWKNDGKKWISGESEDEGAFLVLIFIFSEQLRFRTYIYRVVENSTGYPNIYLFFSKYEFIVTI